MSRISAAFGSKFKPKFKWSLLPGDWTLSSLLKAGGPDKGERYSVAGWFPDEDTGAGVGVAAVAWEGNEGIAGVEDCAS
jgi:hypothetical protein